MRFNICSCSLQSIGEIPLWETFRGLVLSPTVSTNDCQGELKRRILWRLSRGKNHIDILSSWGLSKTLVVYSVGSTTFSRSQRIMEVCALQLSVRLVITCHLRGNS